MSTSVHGSGSSAPARPFRVVIVGGSFAGLATARHLVGSSCEVRVVEPKDFFEYAPGLPHLLAGSGAETALLSPMRRVLGSATHVQGRVASIGESSVTVRSESEELTELPFDALVLASGVAYTSPIRPSSAILSLEARIRQSRSFAAQIEAARSILVNGGGLIGVEIAAEIAHRFRGQNKSITLLNRSPLLGALPAEAGALADRWLRSHGVNVVIQPIARADESTKTAVTADGRSISFDLLVECTGASLFAPAEQRPSNPPYSSRGLVRVNGRMQVLAITKLCTALVEPY